MTRCEYQVCEPLSQELRLDRWLTDQVEDLSRSHLQKLIEQGHVQVNQQVCQSKKYRLQLGDRVQVDIPAPEPLPLEPEAIPLDILYEDDQLLIVNKPSGLVVHPAPGHPTGTLVHALLAHCQSPSGGTSLSGIGGIERPGIVHRLDKDTSGAIAIAKTDQAHQHLQAQFATKTARRIYVAVVHGNPREDAGTIDAPVGRHPGDRNKMGIVPITQGGRPAVTHWQVQNRWGNYTCLQCQLETGRTHQIRVHCALMGWPIVNDPLYSRGRSIKVNLTGQALHAEQLRLQHPMTEEWLSITAPLPSELVKLITLLQQRARF